MFAGRSCAELVQIVSLLVISLGQSRQWMHQACGMCTPVHEKHSNFHDWAKWSHEAIMMIMQYDWKHWSHCSFAAALVLAVPSLVEEVETIDTLGRRGEAMTYVALTSQNAKLIEVFTQYLTLTACVDRLCKVMRCQCGQEIVTACSSVHRLQTELRSRDLLPKLNRWTRNRIVEKAKSHEGESIIV